MWDLIESFLKKTIGFLPFQIRSRKIVIVSKNCKFESLSIKWFSLIAKNVDRYTFNEKEAYMQNLPIGISEFTELRETSCVYVDKTKHIYSLLKNNRRTFLSRPRRFGKSLLVSTLEAALQGKKELFEGLWISKSDYL